MQVLEQHGSWSVRRDSYGLFLNYDPHNYDVTEGRIRNEEHLIECLRAKTWFTARCEKDFLAALAGLKQHQQSKGE